MQKEILPIISTSCLLWFLTTSTLGTLVVSNIDQTPTGSVAIGSDYRIAQIFRIQTSDTNLYRLDSLNLLMDPATGAANNFELSLYSAPLDLPPQDYLGPLVGSSDPSTGGTYSYTASGIELSGGIHYFVVASGSAPIAQGAYNWSASEGVTQNGSWVILNQYYSSSDGSTWEPHSREHVYQMAIYGTIVPEPSALTLVGLGLGSLWLLRRKNRWAVELRAKT